jgi:hypothetical protein
MLFPSLGLDWPRAGPGTAGPARPRLAKGYPGPAIGCPDNRLARPWAGPGMAGLTWPWVGPERDGVSRVSHGLAWPCALPGIGYLATEWLSHGFCLLGWKRMSFISAGRAMFWPCYGLDRPWSELASVCSHYRLGLTWAGLTIG